MSKFKVFLKSKATFEIIANDFDFNLKDNFNSENKIEIIGAEKFISIADDGFAGVQLIFENANGLSKEFQVYLANGEQIAIKANYVSGDINAKNTLIKFRDREVNPQETLNFAQSCETLAYFISDEILAIVEK